MRYTPAQAWAKAFELSYLGVESVLFRAGYGIGEHSENISIQKLIKSLRPQDCGKELIRIGGSADGGYLIPDDLDGIEYCFSPGVNEIADFERDLADRGIRSFLADYSVDFPPVNRPEFVFDKKFLGANNNERYFTLASWKNKYLAGYERDLLLQMDIEGAEYEVILSAPDDLLAQFRIVIIEFHHLHKLFDPLFFGLFESCFQKLAKNFHVAHLHANNCCGVRRYRGIELPKVLEATFYNKRRISTVKDATQIPHPLDRANLKSHKPLNLPSLWYRD